MILTLADYVRRYCCCSCSDDFFYCEYTYNIYKPPSQLFAKIDSSGTIHAKVNKILKKKTMVNKCY